MDFYDGSISCWLFSFRVAIVVVMAVIFWGKCCRGLRMCFLRASQTRQIVIDENFHLTFISVGKCVSTHGKFSCQSRSSLNFFFFFRLSFLQLHLLPFIIRK